MSIVDLLNNYRYKSFDSISDKIEFFDSQIDELLNYKFSHIPNDVDIFYLSEIKELLSCKALLIKLLEKEN